MLAFVIVVVVVGVAIGVVTIAVTSAMFKPATDPADSRRARSKRSRPEPNATGSDAESRSGSAAERSRLAAVAATGRALTDTGRHVGHTLADLARSAVAVDIDSPSPNGERPPREPDVVDTGDEPSTLPSAGTSLPIDASPVRPMATVPVTTPAEPASAADAPTVATAPRRARGQA
ncbi:MAG: hypothetical protein ACRD29_18130, partial [Acidimicrobiales bacterium]